MMYKLPTYLRVPLASALAGLVLLQSQAHGALKHRYSFGEGATADATNRVIMDSVSGANGTVLGTGSSATAGALTLAGGASATQAYVDLPNGIISSLTDATFEGWYTLTSYTTWTRIFDFGSTTGGELAGPGGGGEGLDYIFYAPTRGAAGNIDQQRAGMRNNDAAFRGNAAGPVSGTEDPVIDPEFNHELGVQYHVAVVVDADGGNDPGEATVALYINGGIPPGDGENPEETVLQLGNLNDVNNWLGRSNWTGDQNFNGSFNEFRIYDHALSADEVGKSFFFGPDTAVTGDVFSLEVNSSTGQVKLINEIDQPINFDYYEIKSAGGALSTSGWNSLDDKEGGDPAGQGWDESGGSNANQLIELFLGDTPYSVPANGTLNLGNAFNVGGAQDLTFRFGISDGSGLFLPGSVEYITGPGGVQGDYNNNGTVDAADYVLWRNGGPLANEVASPGVIDQADYTYWRSRFGATSGAAVGSGGGVPEPSMIALLTCCVLALGLRRAPSSRSWLRVGRR